MEPTYSYDMSDIAVELGLRDMEIIKLRRQLAAALARLEPQTGEAPEQGEARPQE